jgi:hypothetical protein
VPSFTARIAAAAIATTLLLAGCGESDASVTGPDRPSYDGGGLTFGGGHRSDSTTATAATSGEATAEGGYTLGGGH